MQPLAHEGAGLLEQRAAQEHRGGDTITAGLLLRVPHRDHHLGRRVLDEKLGDDLGAVVGDGCRPIGLVQHLIESAWTESRFEQVREHLCGADQLVLDLGTAGDLGLVLHNGNRWLGLTLAHGFGRP